MRTEKFFCWNELKLEKISSAKSSLESAILKEKRGEAASDSNSVM